MPEYFSTKESPACEPPVVLYADTNSICWKRIEGRMGLAGLRSGIYRGLYTLHSIDGRALSAIYRKSKDNPMVFSLDHNSLISSTSLERSKLSCDL